MYTIFSHLWFAADELLIHLFSSFQNELSFAITGHVLTVLEHKVTYYNLRAIQFLQNCCTDELPSDTD